MFDLKFVCNTDTVVYIIDSHYVSILHFNLHSSVLVWHDVGGVMQIVCV